MPAVVIQGITCRCFLTGALELFGGDFDRPNDRRKVLPI